MLLKNFIKRPATPRIFTLTRPLRRKLRMRWFLDVSKMKESSFFKSDLTDLPSDFWCASFGNLRPSSFNFSVGFYIKIFSCGINFKDHFACIWSTSRSNLKLTVKRRNFRRFGHLEVDLLKVDWVINRLFLVKVCFGTWPHYVFPISRSKITFNSTIRWKPHTDFPCIFAWKDFEKFCFDPAG